MIKEFESAKRYSKNMQKSFINSESTQKRNKKYFSTNKMLQEEYDDDDDEK